MKTILIVDDEAMARRMLGRTLQKAGYEFIEARDGLHAWELLSESRPDAMITDIDMPRMSGQELCKRIKEEMPDRRFPIFVVTSKTAIEHREWSSGIPRLSFFEKPLSLRRLVGHLEAVLDDSDISTGTAG